MNYRLQTIPASLYRLKIQHPSGAFASLVRFRSTLVAIVSQIGAAQQQPIHGGSGDAFHTNANTVHIQVFMGIFFSICDFGRLQIVQIFVALADGGTRKLFFYSNTYTIHTKKYAARITHLEYSACERVRDCDVHCVRASVSFRFDSCCCMVCEYV